MSYHWILRGGVNVVALACAHFGAPAFAQTSLAWKFSPGQVYEIERIVTQKQTVKITGKPRLQESRSVWHMALTVKERKDDAFVIEVVVPRVEHEVTPKADPLEVRLAEKLKGHAFTLRVTPTGRLVALHGYGDLLKKILDNPPPPAASEKARRTAFEAAFPEAALKESLADLFGPLPDKAVTQGDRWERTFVEPIPHFGAIRSTVNYLYQGQVGQRERIDYTIGTKYEMPKDEMMVLFRIVKGNLGSEKAKGAITFDPSAGHLVEQTRSLVLRGTLTIDLMGREQTLEFTSENALRVLVKKASRD